MRVTPDDFEARSSDELSLLKGDRIELIERDDDFGDGWFLGKHAKTCKSGLFPEGKLVSSLVKLRLILLSVYTTIAPRPSNASLNTSPTPPTLAAANASNLHPYVTIPGHSLTDRIPTENATPPPLNTTPPVQRTSSVPNAALPAAALSGPATPQRSISMVQQDTAEDSPVMNETLSVIDEHITDMNIPRQNMQELERHTTTDSGSEYSAFIDHRISYIAGQETDEEEHNHLTEKEIMSWTPAQVAEHLDDIGVESRHCDIFKEQEISGEVLLAMDQASIFMKEFDLGLVGQRLRTWHKIKALQEEVRTPPTPVQKQKPSFGAVTTSDNWDTTKKAPGDSMTNMTRFSRASTNPLPVPQDLNDPLPSPSFQLAQNQLRDANSTPSSFTFKSGLDSPSRPSAASIRDFNHSRRHSAVDFASSLSPSTPTDQSTHSTSYLSVAASSQHKKTPSLDRNWSMGSPTLSSSTRPLSTVNSGANTGGERNTFDPLTQRHSHAPSSSRDLDRGYRSGDEFDGRRARNVLRKRDNISGNHFRQGSNHGDSKRTSYAGARRHSRFGSVDSIKDTMAAIANPAGKLYHGNNKGHFRNSSAGEAIAKPTLPSKDAVAPTVTKLEYDSRPSMKIVTSSSDRGSGIGMNGSPKSANTPSKASPKPRMGLRAISDAVTGTERSIATSPSSVPSPIKETSHQSPARTGSTTPSGASQNLDRESTDASSKGTNGPQIGLTPTLGTRRKSKKETSAYIRGLEQKSPQEQMIDCDYSGWMKKKSSNMMTTWKPRLFVLRGRRLSYYYSDDDLQEKGLIDISSHRVLPADNDILTGIHAAVTGAKSSPVSPATAHTPTLAATEAAAQTESSLQKAAPDSTFIFKLVPPRSGLSRAVNFTKPTVHYFAVDNVRQGRLWMAALMKATIDRDESKPITTSYQLKTISLAKARSMKQRPPALMNLEEQGESVKDGPKSDETGLNIHGLDLDQDDAGVSNRRSGSLDAITKSTEATPE